MDAEKVEKLKEKYNQLKQANAVLKEGLIEKREACTRLEQQLKEKEQQIRQQLEEIDHLQFQNARQSKQLGTLNAQVEELQKQKQTGGWSMQGFIPGGRQQQEAISRAEEDIRVLRDELMMKIQENEDLHMRVFEATSLHQQEAQRFKESGAALDEEMKRLSSDLEEERSQTSRLRGENQDLAEKLLRVEESLNKATASMETVKAQFEDERQQLRRREHVLESELIKWVPFHDRKHELWNALNCSSFSGRDERREVEVLRRLRGIAGETCLHTRGAFRLWARCFGGWRDNEPVARARVRRKLSDTAELLGTTFGGPEMQDAVRWLASNVGTGTDGASAAAASFKNTVSTVVRAHRRWVTYQCLLLLHHGGRSVGINQQREALSFVDCLWDLHRRVRALFARLRVCSCMSVLMARSSSSSHFELARMALRKGARGQWDEDWELTNAGPSKGAKGADGDSSAYGNAQQLSRSGLVSSVANARLGVAVHDVARGWESVSQFVSRMVAAAQVQEGADAEICQEGGVAVELLEGLHKLSACLSDQLVPLIDQLASGRFASLSSSGGEVEVRAPIAVDDGSGSAVGAPAKPSELYTARFAQRLSTAPAGIGFDESQQTQALARHLSSIRSRLAHEVRELSKRLKAAVGDKAGLADELRALQDSHAVLKQNLQHLQEKGAGMGMAEGNGQDKQAAAKPQAADLVTASRARALMDGSVVTQQETASLRQHGFFVDVLSLSASEATQASGRPNLESLAPWELAVRKVYEQHARNLQAQVRVADSKAMELYLNVQSSMDLLREQEEAKHKLRDELSSKEQSMITLKEDLAMTRKSYDTQLAMLTEHICSLSTRLSEKDAGLATVQTHRVLCGHCGMWNTMGKLMAKESDGKCHTCKEKVLSSS